MPAFKNGFSNLASAPEGATTNAKVCSHAFRRKNAGIQKWFFKFSLGS